MNGIERVEHGALILKAAEELEGPPRCLRWSWEELRALRARIGPRLL